MFYQAERRNIVKESIKDKYEFLHPIGEGSSSKVYLVRHKELSRLFIYKESKPFDWALAQHHHEVFVLRNLSIPGIPDLHEFYESPDSSVIVEEYISGDSLQTILMQFISQEQFISYAIQMMQIVQTLHECPQGPILYLDFKQEHFVVRENKVYLIDFGLATVESEGCKGNVNFGTKQYSAPETVKTQVATIQSDVYSLGVLLREMFDKTRFESTTDEFVARKILTKMTDESVKNRPKSLSEPLEVFFGLQELQSKSDDKNVLSYKIAVVGSQPRVGTTFVATLLTSCLNRLHLPACYQENPQNRWIQGSSLVKEGCYSEEVGRRKMFHFASDFGPFVKRGAVNNIKNGQIHVYDMGIYHEKCDLKAFQLVVMVVGARPWEQHQSKICKNAIRTQARMVFVSTMTTRQEVLELSKQMDEIVYRIPVLCNPYMPERKLCKMILQIKKKLECKK
ncbi:MAG: hypothetical protein E7277_04275 [Lachnospiraceae bacterium]|nr:hypothetical protein [Lachnospiraceae bacterium]